MVCVFDEPNKEIHETSWCQVRGCDLRDSNEEWHTLPRGGQPTARKSSQEVQNFVFYPQDLSYPLSIFMGIEDFRL